MIGSDDGLGAWAGRRVLVTGHTGFKGSWLALMLAELGAEVTGLALVPEQLNGHYHRCRVDERIEHHTIDIRDADAVAKLVDQVRPDVVLHLAAQSLVLRGFRDPVTTFDVNVVGTASVLAACQVSRPAAVLVVTSDKVYANDGSGRFFVEADRLGGGDPYSSSKAATELVVESWRHSFGRTGGPAMATARAGNVIGGGDQAEGRLLPDAYRSLISGVPVPVRNPDAVRPWQFVLEPLSGYLRYADRLVAGAEVPNALNFGPDIADARPVREVLDIVFELWGSGSWEATAHSCGPEAGILHLDASLARRALGWRPRLDLRQALAWTTEWYRVAADGGDCRALALQQIREYRCLEHSC
ncbi:MAG: CDP-glucose 4,6-dehydratase [Actinomycetota bacterium]|nr:CDP-glucose 4,6-dehydratase [Actinomycetota bacterium]